MSERVDDILSAWRASRDRKIRRRNWSGDYHIHWDPDCECWIDSTGKEYKMSLDKMMMGGWEPRPLPCCRCAGTGLEPESNNDKRTY